VVLCVTKPTYTKEHMWLSAIFVSGLKFYEKIHSTKKKNKAKVEELFY
jgi:hypothetical protein